ncbi:N-acetylglucosamine-1-phosphodiester alpha-N-acetylglucosaminidase [Protopterus annectens]|uniref:N-acetylglucosamine-1-phosphodiester alpha-N-acetylglucosaminidase n=1 Tax=Protopterus annectens TaxID=7888 RepID=UPI001CFAEA46|nr:N-acetylglucosamine-1-phosphodiester alpha-N-acetylglucosaminidase [Protopterus annectens]
MYSSFLQDMEIQLPGLCRFHHCLAAVLLLSTYSKCTSNGNSLTDDLLLPYSPNQHGPQHSHRYVRDCQPIQYGNLTHETWPSNALNSLPVASTRLFISKFDTENTQQRTLYGHFTFINNPLRTVSVLEPGGPGGCRHHQRATVETTAKLRKCLVAQNAGFFDTKNGKCHGNVVSDGKLVQSAGGLQNAQFGIRKDGTLVFGYLSEEEVLDKKNPFVQLVSGVVWLLRNGEVYINQSKTAECEKTEETGTFDVFINALSARTAVGHDKSGRLIMFHSDGKTGDTGLTLWELADLLKEKGVINAINMDGGGSSTMVVNGTLASYPSDKCKDNDGWHCARSISTVLCVHDPDCGPENCSGHGECLQGECHCTGYWSGPACEVLLCWSSNCSLHGVCTESGCICDAGWEGKNCSDECAPGFFGDGCSKMCSCTNGGTCNHVHGTCICSSGYHGVFCEQECPLGWFGPLCQHKCQCENQCQCHPTTGACNVTLHTGANDTLNRGYCLASILFAKQRENDHPEQNYLAEKYWIIITFMLGLILFISVTGNLICMFCSADSSNPKYSGTHKTYSYSPLNENITPEEIVESDRLTEVHSETEF